MRTPILVVVVCLAMTAPAVAQTADVQVMTPIQTFMDTFNKGDMTGAAATHLADDGLVIIDEVPPFVWRGATAFTAWGADLEADARKQGATDQRVSISPPTRVEIEGDQAYVIVPAVYSFMLKGVSMRESSQMTFVLKKTSGGWLIHGWTWTGPKAQAAQ